jgi:hypothetical protein
MIMFPKKADLKQKKIVQSRIVDNGKCTMLEFIFRKHINKMKSATEAMIFSIKLLKFI